MEVSSMKKLQVKILAASPVLLAFSSACFADTFTHRKSGEVLHGYIAGRTEDGKTILSTKEKGQVRVNLAQWQIVTDRLGRNNKVIILTIDDEIELEIETEALEREIVKLSNEGPLLILFEIDTPGGRELLSDLDVADAEIVINDEIQKARMELKRARGQLNRQREVH